MERELERLKAEVATAPAIAAGITNEIFEGSCSPDFLLSFSSGVSQYVSPFKVFHDLIRLELGRKTLFKLHAGRLQQLAVSRQRRKKGGEE